MIVLSGFLGCSSGASDASLKASACSDIQVSIVKQAIPAITAELKKIKYPIFDTINIPDSSGEESGIYYAVDVGTVVVTENFLNNPESLAVKQTGCEIDIEFQDPKDPNYDPYSEKGRPPAFVFYAPLKVYTSEFTGICDPQYSNPFCTFDGQGEFTMNVYGNTTISVSLEPDVLTLPNLNIPVTVTTKNNSWTIPNPSAYAVPLEGKSDLTKKVIKEISDQLAPSIQQAVLKGLNDAFSKLNIKFSCTIKNALSDNRTVSCG